MQQVELPPVSVPQKLQVTSRNDSNQSSSSNLSKNIIQQDVEMLQDEIKRLKKFSDSLGSVVKKVDVSRAQSSSTIDQLNKQSRQLQDQIQTYQKILEQSTQKQIERSIEANKKQYIAKWEQRISVASQVNIDVLKQIDIDDKKSIAHELFKWIVVAIYHEPQSKYYYPNFKDQIFEKDDGKDFKERLGKINATNARQQEVLKIKDFLSRYNDILKAQQLIELKQLPKETEKLKRVAQIYLQCNQLAKSTLALEKSIESDKQSSLKKDQEAMKWKAKHEAVQERLQVVQQYLYTLGVIEKDLESKAKNCQTKLIMAQQFLSNLKKGIEISTQDMEKYSSL